MARYAPASRTAQNGPRCEVRSNGAFDVEGGNPVRPGDDSGEAVPGHGIEGRELQHAPRRLPRQDPDEDLLPHRRRVHRTERHRAWLRSCAGPVRCRHGRGHGGGAAEDRSLDRDRAVRSGRLRGRSDALRQGGVLPGARACSTQSLLPSQAGSGRAGPAGHRQDRAEGPRAADRHRPVRSDDAPVHAVLAGRGPLAR